MSLKTLVPAALLATFFALPALAAPGTPPPPPTAAEIAASCDVAVPTATSRIVSTVVTVDQATGGWTALSAECTDEDGPVADPEIPEEGGARCDWALPENGGSMREWCICMEPDEREHLCHEVYPRE